MSFYLNYESPVLKKSFKIKELTFGQFRDLNKYILSNNNIFIESFFDEILTNNLEHKDLLKQLCNYDKFCILVLLRTVNISPELEIFEKNKNFKVPLKDFLNKCLNFTHDTTKTIEHGNIKIKLELPASFVINNLLDLTDMVVKRVEIDNSILNFNEIESELKKEIIETLPANIIFDIKKFYENLVNVFSELSFTLPSINETINLNPFDSSLLEILKLLFRANLKNIYEMQYFMVSKIYYTPEYIDNNTFVENVLLLRLFEDELKKQDELSKKPKQQGMPLMP
jgi:hypothetical protein